MRNPDCLPFPEPDSQETAVIAQALLVLNEYTDGYTVEQARRDAVVFLEYRNSIDSGFLQETGVVKLAGVMFYLSNKQPSQE